MLAHQHSGTRRQNRHRGAHLPEPLLFKYGSKNNDFLGIKGREKEGKWFASANNQNKFLDPRERGNTLNYLKVCLLLTRAVRRMHAAGLCHSDLSYKNVLIDPNRATPVSLTSMG